MLLRFSFWSALFLLHSSIELWAHDVGFSALIGRLSDETVLYSDSYAKMTVDTAPLTKSFLKKVKRDVRLGMYALRGAEVESISNAAQPAASSSSTTRAGARAPAVPPQTFTQWWGQNNGYNNTQSGYNNNTNSNNSGDRRQYYDRDYPNTNAERNMDRSHRVRSPRRSEDGNGYNDRRRSEYDNTAWNPRSDRR